MTVYQFKLSTTAVANQVELIRVRQDDDESQIFRATIFEDGKVKNLNGVSAEFNMVDAQHYIVVDDARIVDATNGIVEYQLRKEAMLSVGRCNAYFSFKSNKEVVYSTKDFNYNVIWSALSSPMHQGCDYVWTASDLIDSLKDWIEHAMGDFDDWFESVKEILASIDPGGIILKEILDTRKSYFSKKKFSSLETRLFSDFNYVDEHLNAIEQTITNVKFFGAVGDGVTDDTATIQALLDNDNAYLYVPNGIYNITSNLRLRNNPTIIFESKDAIFRRMSNECSYLFINGGTGDSFSGYNGNGNIKMVGGTLDLNSNVFNKVNSAVMLRHSANNLFKDLDVLDVANGHAFDMNGCRDTIFDTCRAMGWRDLTVDKSLIAQEAFQLSVAGTDIFNWSVADGTNCKNIKFNNCFTGNSDTEGSVAYNVAVGNHSAYIKENGESIYINSCHFSGGNHYAVRLFGFKDVFGNNNHIEDFTGFIACHSSAGYTWNLDNTKNYEIDMVTRNVHFTNTTLIPKDITSDRQLIIVEGSKDISGKTISIATDILLDGVIVNGSSNMLRKLARIVDTKNVSLINLDVKGLDDGVRGTRNTNLMISGKFSRIKNEVIYLEYSTSIVDNVSCEDCAQNGNNGVVAFEDGCNNNVIRNSSIRLGRLGRQRFAVYADALAERNIVTNNILEGLEGKSLIPHSSSFDGVVLNEGNKAYSLQVIAGKLSVSELKI